MQADFVKFEGRGPFYLRAVERANASYLDDTIQLSLDALADEHGPVRIETMMTPRAAIELAEKILQAVRSASSSSR